MNEYQKILHQIEEKKQKLEAELAQVIGATVAQWQSENSLAVERIYVDLAKVHTIGEPKEYMVTGTSVDIDYKP
ncbi:hypothetical protein OK024_08970 [Acinetobacter sp. UGAL515B_02]|nr:hypothetical protein [Acinetobacter sp. UGAL515B_02]WON79109.1 hypothetical protein OK024_08970 [Acinetobacter sp. UGAL515B_02]